MEQLYFIAGLPRSGSTLICNILKQNPKVHAQAVSGLCTVFNSIHMNWDSIEPHKEYPNHNAKLSVLTSILNTYHSNITKPFIFDKDRMWISKIGLVEAITQKKVKILCCVRNPAEILTSFEKIRKTNPTIAILPDLNLGEKTSIAARAYFYSSPEGALGAAHTGIKDAITEGYVDRLLFVDYSKFCNEPKKQIKRIYDFFELPDYTHDLENISQEEIYDDKIRFLPNLHKIKPKLQKTTVNCVEYLGLDLFQQYNSQIFWDAWI